jgi:hypothetical protein
MAEYKTAYEVCEMKERLEGESNPRGRMINKELRRYVGIFYLTEKVISCITGTSKPNIESDFFSVRAVQWPGLEKAFIEAGYKVLGSSATPR